jgi:sugar phosphate permease
MKELLQKLPQILAMMPEIVKYLKYLPIIMVLAGIGYAAFYFVENKRDPFRCVNNQVFEQLRVDSDVYIFKGETCVDAKDLQ